MSCPALHDTVQHVGDSRDFIETFAKGLAVIQAFSETSPALTITDVAQRTGLSRAAARRFLLTLETLGFAERLDGRTFTLTARVLLLGNAYLSSMPMWRFAEPVLSQMVEDIGETCSISVLDGTEVVYVLRIPVHRILDRISTIGSRLPAYCTSMGRLLLAYLPDAALDTYFVRTPLLPYTARTLTDEGALRASLLMIRRQGYAWLNGEMSVNLNGLAVPIYDRHGRVMAALNVSIRRPDVDPDHLLRTIVPYMRRAAQQISSSTMIACGQLEQASASAL